MIETINVTEKLLHFKKPFSIAYETVNSAKVLFLTLQDTEGRTGIGSASPDPEVTGENVEKSAKILREKLKKNFFEFPEHEWKKYEKKIAVVFRRHPAAAAAVETALLDIAAKQANIFPQNFFERRRNECDILITIGIQPLKETLSEVKKRIREGFSVIKLKCGLSPEEDVEKIHAVRKIMSKEKILLLDANQGYSLREAKAVLQEIKNLDIAAIEQPVKARAFNELKKLRAMGIVPIIADESVTTKESAIRLIKEDCVDGINVKIMKCGGIIPCESLIKEARRKSKKIMLGCMYESNISLTAAAYLALAYPLDFVDLDSGHLDFKNDPAKGGARIQKGKLTIPSPAYL